MAVASCSRDQITTIKWDGGSSINSVKWWINDKQVSSGVKGFEEVLHKLSHLEDNRHFEVLYPMKFWNDEIAGYDVNDPFPFQGRNDLREAMVKILVDKRLHYTQSSFQ